MPDDFNELMDFLAKDEEEAIKGYNDVIAKIQDEHVIAQLKKIKEEEENHLKFLREVKENHELKYVDEHENEEDEGPSEEEKEAMIKKLFGLD